VAEWNAETEVDQTRYYQTHLPSEENLRVALSIEADRMTQVRFRQADLSREFQVVRNELELADSDPRDILMRRVHHAAFSVHSYGRDPIGTRSDIERVSLARLQAFYARYYRPDNAHLVISVDRSRRKARCAWWSESCLARFARSSPPPERTYTEEPAQDGERYVTVRRVGKLPLVELYYHTAAAADPDQAALAALADILVRPGSGRLYKALG
jgi:zinc protease